MSPETKYCHTLRKMHVHCGFVSVFYLFSHFIFFPFSDGNMTLVETTERENLFLWVNC